MAIKLQSQKLLLALLPGDTKEHASMAFDQVRELFFQLSSTGFRSLVGHMETKGLLHHERIGRQSQLYLSEVGKTTLYSLFASLDPQRARWAGNWSCLIFQTAPSGDKQFRYLRKLLVELRAIQFTRGVYLYPGAYPAVFLEQCRKLYIGAISILALGAEQFGSLRPIVVEKGQLLTLAVLYSGISTEVEELLAIKRSSLLLTDQHKMHIASLFDRFIFILKGDIGVGPYYFPDQTWGEQTLQDIRSIVLL